MTTRAPAIEQTAAVAISPPRGWWAEFWARFRRNRVALVALVYLVLIHLAALFAPVLAPYSPERIDLLHAMEVFSPDHWLGTDENGRDILSRLLYGAQISLVVGIVAVAIAALVGVVVGGVAGYFGGWADAWLMRATDAFMSIPTFFLLLTVLTLFGSSLLNIVLVIGLTSWMSVARIVRGEVLKQREMEFVTAARVLGARDTRIMLGHILPQTVPSLTVASTLGVAFAILTESSLSYLGLGVQPPLPSWGNMLTASQNYVWSAPRLVFYPGVLILVTVLAYNALGNALRDTLDPQLKHRG